MEHLLDPIYVGLHILNLIVMVFVLKKLLYKPMSKFMEQRRQAVKEETRAAQEALSAAQALEEQIRAQKLELEQTTRNQSYNILAQAHEKAEQILSEAQAEAEQITLEAQKQADQSLEAAKEQQRQAAAALAVDIAGAVLPRQLSSEQQQQLLEASVEEAMKYEL